MKLRNGGGGSSSTFKSRNNNYSLTESNMQNPNNLSSPFLP